MPGMNTVTALKADKAGRFQSPALPGGARTVPLSIRSFEEVAKSSATALNGGDFLLTVTPFVSFRQVDTFLRELTAAANVKVVSRSWSEEEGLTVAISVPAPVALTPAIEGMPGVAEVRAGGKKHGKKKIEIILNDSPVTDMQQAL